MTQRIVSYREKRDTRRAYAILLPFFAWFLFTIIVPVLFGFGLAFTEWNGLQGLPVWVGLKNFVTFFSSREYTFLLLNQILIGGFCLAANTVFSFFTGLMLNVPFKMRGFFRAVFYIPFVVAVTATTAVVVALLDPHSGAMNTLLKILGLQPVVWSYSGFWMKFWIVAYFVWRNLGPTSIIWLGGLQSISQQLYEAARIDGANKIKEIIYITIPGLRHYAAFIMVTGIIGVMQMFDVIMLISKGGPVGATDTIMYRIYRDGIISFNMGMSGASSVIVGIIIILFSVLYLKITTRGDEN
jgi:ABC-type sugar transport system permease subunit